MKGKMSKDKKKYENCTRYSDLPSDTRVLVDIPSLYACLKLK